MEKSNFGLYAALIILIATILFVIFLLMLAKPDNISSTGHYLTHDYNKGFRDGMDCLALTNLEFSIKKESKTFKELMDICIERNKIKEK